MFNLHLDLRQGFQQALSRLVVQESKRSKVSPEKNLLNFGLLRVLDHIIAILYLGSDIWEVLLKFELLVISQDKRDVLQGKI